MAITTSAKKALRQSKRRKVFNDSRKRAMRSAIKDAKVAGAKVESLSAAYQAIDKAVKRGIIHKNTAARKKAQVAKLFAAKK